MLGQKLADRPELAGWLAGAAAIGAPLDARMAGRLALVASTWARAPVMQPVCQADWPAMKAWLTEVLVHWPDDLEPEGRLPSRVVRVGRARPPAFPDVHLPLGEGRTEQERLDLLMAGLFDAGASLQLLAEAHSAASRDLRLASAWVPLPVLPPLVDPLWTALGVDEEPVHPLERTPDEVLRLAPFEPLRVLAADRLATAVRAAARLLVVPHPVAERVGRKRLQDLHAFGMTVVIEVP